MEIRRVVTGHDAQGKAVVASDEMVVPATVSLTPGWAHHQMWGADATAIVSRRRFAAGGAVCLSSPAPGWLPLQVLHRAARRADDLARGHRLRAARSRSSRAKLPGLAEHLEPEAPGMHTTATVDVGIVISGAATLELDDGTRCS